MKSDAWPFVPPAHHKKLDESPFRVRGSVYTGNLEILHKHIPGGFATFAAEIKNKEIESFLRETIFLAASSYAIEPLIFLQRFLAQATRSPLDKFVRDASRIAAERDVVGTYRAQLRSASPEEMAHRLPRMFVRYFEPCQAESLHVSPGRSEVRLAGLPASALGLYVWASEGFIAGGLESVGAREVRFVWSAPSSDGESDGIPLQSLNGRITWTNPVA